MGSSKGRSQRAKHGVTFDEARTVFADGLAGNRSGSRSFFRPAYRPDFFNNRKPNRFAGMPFAPPIYLDKDVAEVFDSSEAVNSVLRSAIKAMRTAAPKRSASMPAQKRRCRKAAGRLAAR